MKKPVSIEPQCCINCGTSGPLHKHHVQGRQLSKMTVNLCPNCHATWHRGFLLFENTAAKRFEDWIDDCLAKDHFPTSAEQAVKIKEYGYLPLWDNQIVPREIAQTLANFGWQLDGLIVNGRYVGGMVHDGKL